jgi:SecD/SecF fusion protein
MQGKNIVKFFMVILIVVCAIQYFFIFPTNSVEKEADQFAAEASKGIDDEDQALAAYKAARTGFLDSVSSEEVFSIPLIKSYTYEELKRQQLALGLDLKGGMSVVLQVDLKEFLLTLSENSKNARFTEALDMASEKQRTSTVDYITLFSEAYNGLDGAEPLANIFVRNPSLKDRINYETSNAEVVRVLRELANETVDLTFKRLKDRIDKFGVTQPNVSLDANRDIIVVELPGIDNPERARRFLQASARLEFWDVYRSTDPGIGAAITEANRVLGTLTKGESATADTSAGMRKDTIWNYINDETTGAVIDSVMEIVDVPDTSANILGASGPLFDVLELNVGGAQGFTSPPSVIGYAAKNKIKLINDYLSRPEVLRLFPADMVFRWSAKPMKDPTTGKEDGRYELYALRKKRGGEGPGLTGERVINASAQPDPITNQVTVSLKMDNAGARIWNEMTTYASNDNNREVAIVLDDEVVSAPSVRQPIPSGDSQISGNFTIQEAKDLANILQVGKLPAKTRIIQEALVGPSLGSENIRSSIWSLAVGFGLLLLFMVVYYSSSGFVSIIALLANVFFIFGVLASYGTVLTLPGIAGIVLTIGMAVDANVIIYERIKEELLEGKTLLQAITDGFRHSYSSIIDANVTTLLTAIVLAYFGLGPIKGFAVVLIIGILCTMFSAVLIARLAIDWWTEKGRPLSFSTGFSSKIFTSSNIDFLGKRKLFYGVSGVVILLGIVSFFVRGFEFGVDFKGGYSYNVTFEQAVDAQKLRENLGTAFGSQPIVKAVDTRNTFNIVTSYKIDDNTENVESQVMDKLFEGVNATAGGSLSIDKFKDPDFKGTRVTSFSKVGPTIAEDIRSSALSATIFSILLIFIYIFIRFSRWQYSAGSVAALLHDTAVLLAIFSIFHGVLPFTMEIDQAFIAALLTVLGYSMNDTVIVFDRIREYLNTYTNRNPTQVVNEALNKTLNRTIITSFTTLIVVLILFIFGGSSIKGFAFALVVGIVVGTYSSLFIATPVMFDLSKNLQFDETKHGHGDHAHAQKSAKA